MKAELSKNDYYTQKAKEENYPARSVYKLKEIDKNFQIFHRGQKVLDLGAAPGSWLMHIAQRIGRGGQVIGVDKDDLKIVLQPNMEFCKMDLESPEFLVSDIFSQKFGAVVSDIAPKTIGIKFCDTERSYELAKMALAIAIQVLEKNGNFVCKMFEGPRTKEFLKEVGEFFKIAKIVKPQAILKGSREFYVVGKNFKCLSP